MGPYSQLVPIFLLFGLAPLVSLIMLILATRLRSPATRPGFLRGFTRVWLVAILVGAGLGLVGFLTSGVVYLLSR